MKREREREMEGERELERERDIHTYIYKCTYIRIDTDRHKNCLKYLFA